MAAAILIIKALIAILAVAMLWPKSPPRFKKTLILLIAGLWFVSAILESIQQRRSSSEQAKMNTAQTRIADAMDVLKKNSEQEKQNKEVDAERRQEIRKQLIAFLKEGREARNKCVLPQSDAEQVWTRKVESYLHDTSLADEEIFKENEMPFVCYQSISSKLWVLQRIIDRNN